MNRGTKNDLGDVIRELEKVKISHERTGKLLKTLSDKIERLQDNQQGITERNITLEESRYLIGEQVRIVNPHKGEKNIGSILAVGKLFITVDLGEGTKRNRVAKNLRLILS